jgi:lysophospholipase L1-like esterase
MRTTIKGPICRALQAFAVLVMVARRGALKSSGATRLLPAFAGSVLLGVLTACGGGGGATSPSATLTSGVLQNCTSIMPLGDSITLGVNGGYRNDLYTGLQQNNCGVSYVGTEYDQGTRVVDKDHEGHSGFTIADIAGSVNAWMASTQPDIILLMIGTNDTAWWTAENADQIGARHDALIEQLRTARPNASIFVASIPPQSSAIIQPNNVDRAALTQQLNEVIKSNVEARVALGQRVRFVDVNSALTTADLYDGIHPTEAAHAMVAQKFLEAIRAALGSA